MVENGAMTDSSTWTYRNDGRNPRTALGVKADGTLLLYVVDGRQSGYSKGLSQVELADELMDQGCVWAVNLDGGGSSTFSIKAPGDTSAIIYNSPSDGRARSCATYILLVSDDKADGVPASLARKGGGLVACTGSSVAIDQIIALDAAGSPARSTPSDLTFSCNGTLGSVTADGVYTAGGKAGTDVITVTSPSLGISGTLEVHIVDNLDDLTVYTVDEAGNRTAATSLTLDVGSSLQLAVSGSYCGHEALRSPVGVTWTLTSDQQVELGAEPVSLGSVDGNGLFTASYAGGTGTLTVSAGGLTKTLPVRLKNLHLDVGEDRWSYGAVEFCYDKGIVSGISPTEFGAEYNVIRGDFMLMLYRVAGEPAVEGQAKFTDVASDDYYATAIAWAQEQGIASGVGDGAFGAQQAVTREQAFTMIDRVLPLLGYEYAQGGSHVLEQFQDRDSIADYAASHVATLVAQGLVSGGGGYVNPQGNLTREEMAALIQNIMTFEPVAVEADTLSLEEEYLTVECGQQYQLTAHTDPEGAAVTWSSSDETVAVISKNGVLTNLNASGETATVTVTAASGKASDTCVVECPSGGRYGVVTDAEDGLNLRSGPGTQYDRLALIPNQTKLLVLEQGEDGWCRVAYTDAKTGSVLLGYVSGTYLQMN